MRERERENSVVCWPEFYRPLCIFLCPPLDGTHVLVIFVTFSPSEGVCEWTCVCYFVFDLGIRSEWTKSDDCWWTILYSPPPPPFLLQTSWSSVNTHHYHYSVKMWYITFIKKKSLELMLLNDMVHYRMCYIYVQRWMQSILGMYRCGQNCKYCTV